MRPINLASFVDTDSAPVKKIDERAQMGWQQRDQFVKLLLLKKAPSRWRLFQQTYLWYELEFVWEGGGGGRWNGYSYYVRIKVENSGGTRAEKVQVSALNLAKRGADNKFTDIPTTLPFNMKWSNSPPTGPVTVLDGISRKMSAFCDIIGLCSPDNPYQRRPAGTPAGATVGQLQMEFDPAEEWHLLAPGTYRLTLRIGAANVEPIDKIIEFTHDGRWTDDDITMRRDYLGVSLK